MLLPAIRDQCVTVLIHACVSVWQLEDLHLQIVALSLNEWILELEYFVLEY